MPVEDVCTAASQASLCLCIQLYLRDTSEFSQTHSVPKCLTTSDTLSASGTLHTHTHTHTAINTESWYLHCKRPCALTYSIKFLGLPQFVLIFPETLPSKVYYMWVRMLAVDTYTLWNIFLYLSNTFVVLWIIFCPFIPDLFAFWVIFAVRNHHCCSIIAAGTWH